MSKPQPISKATTRAIVSKAKAHSQWVNKKRYPKQKCVGVYLMQRGRRRFVLADPLFGVEHMFNSHEAAKAWGWAKVA